MAKKKTSSKAKSNDNLLYAVVVLGILVVISLGMNVRVSNQLSDISMAITDGVQAAPPGDNGGDTAPPPTPTVEVGVDDDPVLGKSDAPITIIEFSDFQCPFCKRFVDQTMAQIKAEYVDTGKAKIVFRDFPLSMHPQAQIASEAAECADEQGKYWAFHDHIFANQATLSEASLKAWAGELGLNQARFDECLDSGKYTEEVQADFAAGQAAGVTGTPTFFINGKKLVGAHPFDTFKQVLDAELS